MTRPLDDWKQELIALMVTRRALLFDAEHGFTLKSKRISPYFFNAGLLSDGEAQLRLGRGYARMIRAVWGKEADLLYGPAYKGIPLVTAAAIGYCIEYERPIQFNFNRKETKDHGEGGVIVGPSMKGRQVIVVDDVITAGSALRESAAYIHQAGGHLDGLVVILDRQEKGQKVTGVGENEVREDLPFSAVQQVRDDYQIRVASILTFTDLLAYLKLRMFPSSEDIIGAMERYHVRYGA